MYLGVLVQILSYSREKVAPVTSIHFRLGVVVRSQMISVSFQTFEALRTVLAIDILLFVDALVVVAQGSLCGALVRAPFTLDYFLPSSCMHPLTVALQTLGVAKHPVTGGTLSGLQVVAMGANVIPQLSATNRRFADGTPDKSFRQNLSF